MHPCAWKVSTLDCFNMDVPFLLLLSQFGTQPYFKTLTFPLEQKCWFSTCYLHCIFSQSPDAQHMHSGLYFPVMPWASGNPIYLLKLECAIGTLELVPVGGGVGTMSHNSLHCFIEFWQVPLPHHYNVSCREFWISWLSPPYMTQNYSSHESPKLHFIFLLRFYFLLKP